MLFNIFSRLRRRPERLPAITAERLLHDLNRVDTFQVLSDTTARALALTNDPNATLAEVAELVRRDSVLTVAVLKLANSMAYRGKFAVDDLKKAVPRLGLRGCRQVLATAGMRGVFRNRPPQMADACEALLRHGLFTAALAGQLNAVAGIGFGGEAFTAGMLHDIGRLVVCVRAPDAFAQVDPLTFTETPAVLDTERALLGTTHCEVGGRFARVNGLSEAVTAAIEGHHAPVAEKQFPLLVALTAAADDLANHVQRERTLKAYRPARARVRGPARDIGECAGRLYATQTRRDRGRGDPRNPRNASRVYLARPNERGYTCPNTGATAWRAGFGSGSSGSASPGPRARTSSLPTATRSH